MAQPDASLVSFYERRITRRLFARAAVTGGAAMWMAGNWGETPLSAATLTDVDILNFALNLEYVDGEFFTIATSGLTLAESGVNITGTGAPGPTIGGRKLALSDTTFAVASELARDEQGHIKTLRAALGAAAIAKPTIDLTVADVRDEIGFLTVARIFEDVGMTAYVGGAPMLTDRTNLAATAQILADESQHAGALRSQIAFRSTLRPSRSMPSTSSIACSMPMRQVDAGAVSALPPAVARVTAGTGAR
jgi:ferritin-like protein